MNRSSILDFGGKSFTSSTAVRSHLNSGPPRITDAYHPKRIKHNDEETKQNIADLRTRVENKLRTILQTSNLRSAYASVYSDVERLCRAKHSEQSSLAAFIFEQIDETLSVRVTPTISQCFSEMTDEVAEDVARRFVRICREWNESLTLLSQVCLYLDRSYLLPHPKYQCIKEYGMSSFVQGLLVQTRSDPEEKLNDPLCKMVASLLTKVRYNRTDLGISYVLQNVLGFLEEIDSEGKLNVNDVLHEIFSKEYIFSHKKWLKDKKTYVLQFLQSLKHDNMVLFGCNKSQSFVKKLNQELKWKFLLSDLNLFVEPGLPVLLLPQNHEYLHVLEIYCKNSMEDFGCDSLQVLVAIWGKYLEGKLQALSLDQDIATSILTVWKESELICEKGFISENFEFQTRSSFKKALGQKEVSAAVISSLAKYCDCGLKQGRRPDMEFEKSVIEIFKLVSEKSAFLSIYERDLSKRILMSRKFDYDQEKAMVDALVRVVGEDDENFCIRAMLRDYSRSKATFSNLRLSSTPHIDFSALILEKKVWPDIPGFGSDICLPQALSQPLNDFANIFAEDAKHKVLDWNNYTLHQITLASQFGTETKELQVNLSQAMVLMLFEDNNTLSVSQILDSTRMDARILQRVINSLSTEKHPILIVENDLVTINDNFTDKSNKIKLPMGKERDVVSVEEVKKLVLEERSSEARAVLVRIMKKHKTLQFTELLGKAIGALESRGTFPIQDLKDEIEKLIEAEYIARDVTGTTLVYIP